MGQVFGSTQSVEIDITNVGSTGFKSLVCLRTSSINTTMDATVEQTNCGVLTSPSEPQMTLDFDAICEVTPTGTQISYEDLLLCAKNKTIVMVRVQNPTVTGSSQGTAYYHRFSGYITDLTWNQATSEFINFSGTIQSTGELDVDPAA
jgi:hypothetical protein